MRPKTSYDRLLLVSQPASQFRSVCLKIRWRAPSELAPDMHQGWTQNTNWSKLCWELCTQQPHTHTHTDTNKQRYNRVPINDTSFQTGKRNHFADFPHQTLKPLFQVTKTQDFFRISKETHCKEEGKKGRREWERGEERERGEFAERLATWNPFFQHLRVEDLLLSA